MAIYYNPALKNMDFEEWCQWKREEKKRKTHNAEEITDNAVYSAFFAINDICFKKALYYTPLFFIPPDLTEENPDNVGMYGYGVIMISKPYYEEHGLDTEFLQTLYHEMVHAYCDAHGITDAKGKKHLAAFATVCEENGGFASFEDEIHGFSKVIIRTEKLDSIKERVKERTAKL